MIKGAIADHLRRYNPTQLLLWIEVAAIHPSNQLFGKRFEFLLALLFSIPANCFEGKNLTRDLFIEIINLPNKHSEFTALEDWQPFPQLKLIPFFMNGEKFYFFYGGIDRPYEELRQLVDIYMIDSSGNTHEELTVLRKAFLLGLRRQTEIVCKLRDIEEAAVADENLYVPSQGFFDLIAPLFRVDQHDMNDLLAFPVLEEGCINGSEKEILSFCLSSELFKTFFVHLTTTNSYYLIPQLHISCFHNLANGIIEKSPLKADIESHIMQSLLHRLNRECFRFFTITNVVEMLERGSDKALTGPVDMIVRVDSNKLLLFKAVGHVSSFDLTNPIRVAERELHKFIDSIRSRDEIVLRYLNKDCVEVRAKDMEFLPALVFERRRMTAVIQRDPEPLPYDSWIVHMMDLRAIFEFLESGMSLIKFLRSDRELTTKHRVVSIDYIDRFAYYLANRESYPRLGLFPSLIVFSPHQWSDFYQNEIFSRHGDSIYELIESRYPRKFNRIRKIHGNIYELFDSIYFDGGLAVKQGEGLTVIMYPLESINCTRMEIEISRLVGQLFADYIDRLYDQLVALFRTHDSAFGKDNLVGLYPASYVARRDKLAFLRPYTSQLNSRRPLLAITKRRPGSKGLQTWIIYDDTLPQSYFSSEENVGERLCIKELVRSFITCLDPLLEESAVEQVSDLFVNQNIPLRRRAYSLDRIPFENPKIDAYPRCKGLSRPDYSRTQCEISEYLARNGQKVGEYDGEHAKLLFNAIFAFLQDKLEQIIASYDRSILYYAYQQLEALEAERETSRVQLGVDASKTTDYDVVQQNIHWLQRISTLSMSARHIIETALKGGMPGTRAIDEETWLYLQALAATIQEVATISDFLHYDIQPCLIRISEAYEIEIVRGDAAFDVEQFYEKESQLDVDFAKQELLKRKKALDIERGANLRDSFPSHKYLTDVDTAFLDEFSFSLKSLLRVLVALGRLELFDDEKFPLTLIQQHRLVDKLAEVHVREISEAEIVRVLEFASMSFSSSKEATDLTPSAYLRRKRRLSVCPLVRLNSAEYLYGNQMCLVAADYWMKSVLSANFPYPLPSESRIGRILAEWHDHLDRELEKKAELEAIQCAGKENVEARIKNFKRISRDLPKDPECGEIDLLVVNKMTKKIFVLDAKNMTRTIRPYEIRREMERFLGEKGSYLEKLSRKETFVRNNLRIFLRHFSVPDETGWEVRKAFVVDSNYPSAHAARQTVSFVFVDDLGKFLGNGGES